VTSSLWNGGVTPGNGDVDAPQWTLGTRVEPKVPGTVSGISWYMRPGLTGAVGARLYNADTQAQLASAAFGSIATGWQTATFTPVDVTGVNLIAAVYTSASGHYPFDSGVWPVENDELLAPSPAGSFHASGDVFPENGTPLCFYVDVVFTEAGSVVEGSGMAALGGLAAVGAGVRRKVGAGTAALGALLGTGAGQRRRLGSGLGALGGLTAAGTGTRRKLGAGVAPLGGLHAVAIVGETVVHPPDTGTITRPNTGLIHVPHVSYP